ncbi:F0F1 ATP synthase subunit epsilon [Alkaliphilus sp. MSJ-5]|uniref:ATP synthase epsilon chain n=1 Tax=Alkaliphilus flagellatus TaxID=2841507 RepID=A0ABS6G2A0_9FIRM|nr:F0F1 ATP synthase subunit epsilon [Alkaliphilus flagellatus]MBU5676600.1 F0F1 ATP synthase subunit epsilon [Alkaliphilus flagellatus]
MASTFRLQIVTPSRMFYDDEVEMTIVRTIEGDVGIMRNHMLMVAPLKIGKIRIKKDGQFKEAAISEGFIQIESDYTRIITDSAEWPDEIDVKRAEEAKERAERRLAASKSDIDKVRAEIALKKALNRLDVADEKK